MPIVRVLIFRGTGGVLNKDHPYHDEAPLVRAGHVGIANVIEGKIIGFHPTPEAVVAAGGVEALLNALSEYQPQPGCLQDDTRYFERADELVESTNGRTTVYTYDAEISTDALKSIRIWYDEEREATYNFPYNDGQFASSDSNCATFWMRFGVELPVRTGSIRTIVEKAIAEDYMRWRPNDTS